MISIKAPHNPDWVQLNTAVATARRCIAQAGDKLPRLQVELICQNRGDNGAFDFKSTGNNITITGSEEGLRCGLYTLLQHLGIHWISPAEEMIFPTAPVKFDPATLNGHHAPDFAYRGLHICGARNQFELKLGQWMSYNRMNRKLTHLPQVPIIGAELKKLGLKPDTTVHAYREFIPEKKYFKTHPEYFALVGGKRTPYSKQGQLCLSNMAMREAFTRELLAVIKANPNLGVIGICPEDGYGHCECAKCRALNTPEDNKTGHTVNGRIADFVQDICARVAAAAPGRMLGHYSYSNFANFMAELREVPENLLVSFTIGHCYRHGLDDPSCPHNPAVYKRLAYLRSKIRHVYIYDYYGVRWEKMPSPYLPAQEKDFRLWKKMGIDGFMTEVLPSTHVFWDGLYPAVYYASQLLWQANYPYEQALREMCRIRYGRAADAMTDYFMAFQSAGQKMPGCFTRSVKNFAEILTPQMRQKCQTALVKAKRLAPDNALVQKEAQLFDYWCKNLQIREKYCTKHQLKSRRLDAPGFKPQPVYLVNWSTQLPDLDNNTEVEVATDDQVIRFRLKLHEQKMANMRIYPGKVWGAENVELFLNDGTDPRKCYHFIISPDCRHLASECIGSKWNFNWAHHATFKSARYQNYWTLEITVPKRDIKVQKQFGFSLIRNRYAGGDWDVLGTPDGGAFFKPEKYIQVQ